MVQAPDLISALLELGSCKSADLDEAEARQLIYGGSLELNLLELNLVQEAELLQALGHRSPLPAASVGPIPLERTISTAVRAVVRDAAAGFRADGSVVVSLFGLPTDEELQALTAACDGRPVSFQRTTSLRLGEALALLDGSLLGRRLEAQLARAGLPAAELQAGPPPAPPTPAAQTATAETAVDETATTETATAETAVDTPSAEGAPAEPPTDADVEAGAQTSSLRSDPEPEPIRALPPPVADAPPSNSSLSELSRLVSQEGTPLPAVERHVAVRTAPTSAPAESASEETAPPPAGYQELARSVIPPPPAERAPHESAAPHAPSEPAYPQRQAILDLSTAKDRDTIVSTICRFCAQYFEYVAVFGIQSSEARGLAASGPGKSSERITDLRVPLDVPSALSRVKESAQHRVARLRAGGLEGGLVRDLERPLGRAVLLLPIAVQGRTLLLIWADDGQDDVDIEHALPALGIMRVAATSLERVLIERKRASRLARPSLVPAVGATKPEASTAETNPKANTPERPAAAAAAPVQPVSTSAAAPETAPPAPAPAPPPAAHIYDTRPTRLGMSVPPMGGRRMSSAPAPRGEAARLAPPLEARHETKRDLAPPEARVSSPPVPARPASEIPRKRKLSESFIEAEPPKTSSAPAPGSSDPPLTFPSSYPRTMKGYPTDIRLKAGVSPAPKISAPLLSRRIVTVSEQPRAEAKEPGEKDAATKGAEAKQADTTSADGRSGAAKSAAMHTQPSAAPETAPGDPRTIGTDSPSGGTMLSPRAEIDSPPPRISDKPARPSPAPLSYRALVGQWLEGDERALGRLLEGGESAVGALIAVFPGPVNEPASPQTRASECGPVLQAIAAIGTKATPFLTVRTADEDATVRRWAVFLLGELPGRDAARAIADRLLDETVDVRRAALASARRVQSDALTRRTLRARLEEMTRDSQLMTDERCAAVEAIADIREYESIPTLLQLLDDESSALKRAARWALSVLTRHDFQEDAEKWREFWQRHRNEPRSEWLLLALKASSDDLARAAADEIESLLGESVGDIERLTDDNIAHLRSKLRAR